MVLFIFVCGDYVVAFDLVITGSFLILGFVYLIVGVLMVLYGYGLYSLFCFVVGLLLFVV